MPCGREGIYFISLFASAENFTMIADHYFTSEGYLFRYNTWVTNKKQEKALLWYN